MSGATLVAEYTTKDGAVWRYEDDSGETYQISDTRGCWTVWRDIWNAIEQDWEGELICQGEINVRSWLKKNSITKLVS
jgi:hypothetical protein